MKFLTTTSSLLAALTLCAFGESRTHTVESGDTLYSIARRHKVSAANVMKWNKISNPNTLKVGTKLSVSPKTSTASTSKKTSSSSKKSSNGRYVVSRGDTFYSIARNYKISVSTLQALNPNVRASSLSPGQSLVVKGSPKKTTIKKTVAKKPSVKKETKPAVEKPAITEKVAKATPPEPKITPAEEIIKAAQSPELLPKSDNAPITIMHNSPIATPPIPPVIKEAPRPVLKTPITSIILTENIEFMDIAKKHKTNTAQLNALNGWNYPSSTLLAEGSEIFVPRVK